jgi:hypothetical protein
MNDEKLIKAAKAKLYNLKSGIEGIIQFMDSGIMSPDAGIDAAASLTAKMNADWTARTAAPV